MGKLRRGGAAEWGSRGEGELQSGGAAERGRYELCAMSTNCSSHDFAKARFFFSLQLLVVTSNAKFIAICSYDL